MSDPSCIKEERILILDEIVREKEKEIREKKANISQKTLIEDLKGSLRGISFKDAISSPGKVNIIAEIKGRSPSRGVLKERVEPQALARVYEANGASAISVLTDGPFFGGSLEDLILVRQVTSLPVLRKDFIIDEYQIYESALAGAHAILLIVKLLSQEQLYSYLRLAGFLGMDALVEVHSEGELECALNAGAQIIGINNRDLTDFSLDLGVTLGLASKVPGDKILVSESGILAGRDVERVATVGINAILVGSALMEASDPGMKLRELSHKGGAPYEDQD